MFLRADVIFSGLSSLSVLIICMLVNGLYGVLKIRSFWTF